MKIRAVSIAGLLAAVALAAPAQADSLVGADRFLCTAVEATVCDLDDGCLSGPPRNWNVPQFMEVDLKAKALSTTKASGENRTTPIAHVVRDEGTIFLQGVEGGEPSAGRSTRRPANCRSRWPSTARPWRFSAPARR